MSKSRSILPVLACFWVMVAPFLAGASLRLGLGAPVGWLTGLPASDNLLLRSDGTNGGIQAWLVVLGDDGSLTLPDEAFMRINENSANRALWRINSANTGFGQGGVGNPTIIVGGVNVLEVDSTSASAPRVANRYPIELDAGGTGTEAFIRFSGIAGNRTARFGMGDGSGVCDSATDCDRFSFALPADPSTGESVESVQITSKGFDLLEVAAPGTPAAGRITCYADSADGDVKCKNDAGTVVTIADFP